MRNKIAAPGEAYHNAFSIFGKYQPLTGSILSKFGHAVDIEPLRYFASAAIDCFYAHIDNQRDFFIGLAPTGNLIPAIIPL